MGHKVLSFGSNSPVFDYSMTPPGMEYVCWGVGGRRGASLVTFVPLRGDGKNLITLAPDPGVFCLCDGYSTLQLAELTHKNELCKMKIK